MKKLLKNESGFSVIELLLALILTVAISGVGYMVYHDNHTTKTAASLSTSGKDQITSKIPQLASTTTKPVDPTANWNTYTSTLGNFSFKYPDTGWTIYSNGSFTNPQISSTDTEIDLEENVGQGSSINGNKYIIDLDIAPNIADVSTEAAAPGNYNQGTVVSLSNNLQLWSSNENSSVGCNSGLFLDLVDNGNAYLQLSNGKAITWEASFCWGYRATTTLTYHQQVSSSEAIIAKEVLASYKF